MNVGDENKVRGILTYPPDQYDWWQVTINQASPPDYEIRWYILDGNECSNYYGHYLSLFDKDGEEITWDGEPENHYYIIQIPLSPGLYYIRLEQCSESCYYELSIVMY